MSVTSRQQHQQLFNDYCHHCCFYRQPCVGRSFGRCRLFWSLHRLRSPVIPLVALLGDRRLAVRNSFRSFYLSTWLQFIQFHALRQWQRCGILFRWQTRERLSTPPIRTDVEIRRRRIWEVYSKPHVVILQHKGSITAFQRNKAEYWDYCDFVDRREIRPTFYGKTACDIASHFLLNAADQAVYSIRFHRIST